MDEAFEACPVSFTPGAIEKVRELLAETGEDNLALRIFVQGGGCAGFQYGFAFDEAGAEDDMSFENGGARLLLDPMSMQYLMGAEVDYEDGLEGSRFVIKNPNAESTCSCGSSFAM
ncbi:MAG: iron-sulfur cluster insertion protein ErpA [Gammaproteobacteria bacterium]|nr:iron-sulfur cluster insertion protein ErpA [Gammaproteobacteria bacterium]